MLTDYIISLYDNSTDSLMLLLCLIDVINTSLNVLWGPTLARDVMSCIYPICYMSHMNDKENVVLFIQCDYFM